MCYFKASDHSDGQLSPPVLSANSLFIIVSTRNCTKEWLASVELLGLFSNTKSPLTYVLFVLCFMWKCLQGSWTPRPCLGPTTPHGNRRFSVTPTSLKPSNKECQHKTHNQIFLSIKALIGEDATTFVNQSNMRSQFTPSVCYRVATPFGGFDKAPKTITFKLPELDLNPPNFPELQAPGIKRPSFNRTAQGWITEATHMIIPTTPLECINVPESDDL